MAMSPLTKRILSGIDYDLAREKRRDNFEYLHKHLREKNGMSQLLDGSTASGSFIPFCYPYLIDDGASLRDTLIKNRIYSPVYWPELKNSKVLNSSEITFVNNIVCMPIDQRYTTADMNRIIECVDSF